MEVQDQVTLEHKMLQRHAMHLELVVGQGVVGPCHRRTEMFARTE